MELRLGRTKNNTLADLSGGAGGARLSQIRVPRWLPNELRAGLMVHGFADASERAYAAVVYLRTVTTENRSVSLVTAKIRVAPLKQISLLRLELSGATLLARRLHPAYTQTSWTRRRSRLSVIKFYCSSGMDSRIPVSLKDVAN